METRGSGSSGNGRNPIQPRGTPSGDRASSIAPCGDENRPGRDAASEARVTCCFGIWVTLYVWMRIRTSSTSAGVWAGDMIYEGFADSDPEDCVVCIFDFRGTVLQRGL